jgi:lipopolysaccharide exporter
MFPMKSVSAEQAGSALLWRVAQLACVKGLFLIRLLVLARLLAPEDFGLMAIATVAIGCLMTITDMGMVPALVQRVDVNESHYHSAWTLGVLRAAVVTVIIVLAAPFIAQLFGEPKAAPIIGVLAFRPVIDALASIKVAEITRNLQFRSLALIHVPAAIVELTVSLAFARAFGVWSLVIGALAGAFTGAVASYALAPYTPRLLLQTDAIRPLIRYGRWLFVTGLVTLAGGAVLQIAISRRLGSSELGVYFLAAKLAFLPYEVISEIVGSVAFPLYSRLQLDLVQTGRTFRTIFTGMVSLLLPIYALMIVFAPPLAQDVLGPRWSGTGPLIQLLAVVGIVGIFGDATGPVLRGLGRPDKILALEAVQSGLLIVFIWYFAGHYGLIGAGLAWLLAIGVSQIFSAVFVWRVLQRPFTGLAAPILSIIVATSASATVAIGVRNMLPGLGGFMVAAFVALTITGLLLWVFDRWFDLGLTMSLRQAFPQVASLIGVSAAGG